MKFSITSKHNKISSLAQKNFAHFIHKIQARLPHLKPDLIRLNMVIKNQTALFHPSKIHLQRTKTYSSSKTAQAFYESTLRLVLPKKLIYIRSRGQTLDESIRSAFEKLLSKIDSYKDKYFSSQSQNPKTFIGKRMRYG